MKTILLAILLVAPAGCWSSRTSVCEAWLASGEVASSLDHCVQCTKTYGTGDVRSVRDCAFKKEVAQVRDGY